MNFHEYQSKQLLAEYGIPVPAGKVAATPDEAVAAANSLGQGPWMVKAQIHAGGRGKAGGVKFCKTTDDVKAAAAKMLGTKMATYQTAGVELPVNLVLVTTAGEIVKELYLSVLVDRGTKTITYIASSEGGVEIEQVAAETPELIHSLNVDFVEGVQGYLALVEINPLAILDDGNLYALDGKFDSDDNAAFRQKALVAMRDKTQEDPTEVIASELDINYVTMDGNIGCMVNGAGLAMATMDVIKLNGGEPANFLDVGGGANKQRVIEAFKLILSSDKVEGIFVNIFGGIVRCDMIAEGIIAAVKEVGVKVPVVVRLEGTNVEEGKQLLRDSGMAIIPADNINDGAKKVV
ncbi:MAG: ADP-forming succinate--CoA ligase subunit beta, partial [Stenotrophomonas indicatrix]|uniref:succinate--CoA ligase subunit beta n=1 Tax=Stenotrophomonas indicatrix TaxID=2045451 RepID=UPI00242C4A6E